jgi:hypothetical protein
MVPQPPSASSLDLRLALVQTREQIDGVSGLEQLTVPPDRLPPGCQLRPAGDGAFGGMFGPNPANIKDPDARLGLSWHLRVRDAFERETLALAEAVESAYAASYREKGGSPEIGVYAVRLKKPLSDPQARQFLVQDGARANARRILKGSVAIYVWSDARADARDLGCFEVVRDHIEKTAVK